MDKMTAIIQSVNHRQDGGENMRMSKEAMARHHDDIVDAASRMLRERGIEGASVVDLMRAVGLTHGGFYRHFASKDALVSEAVAAAFKTLASNYDARTTKFGAERSARQYVADYLSERHIANPAHGCPIAAIGNEAARQGAETKKVFAEGARSLVARLAGAMRGSQKARAQEAWRELAMLVGAVVIARTVGDDPARSEVLNACRQRLGKLEKGEKKPD